jgi:alcohol dehydrogenase
MKPFNFHNPGKLVFGEGASRNAATELLALNATRPVLITDETMAGSKGVEEVRASLGEALVAQFTEVVPDTGFEIIDEAAEIAREARADSVISIGGGSSIDTAKAVAAMLGTGVTRVSEIIGFYKLAKRPVPHVVIPTTAGTGSECTSMAVIKDRANNKKVLLMDQKLIPDVGILDPVLAATMPKGVTAATGMDAMTHAAEAIMSKRGIPIADALALHAISLIKANLPLAGTKGDDLEARGLMLIAAAEAGQAFQNAYVGVVHAMAHALGGLVGVPHGLANGILLWVGMEYNAEAVPEKVARIGQAMGISMSGNVKDDAAASVKAMRDFAAEVGIPLRLKNAGVDDSCLAAAAALALADAAMFSNPRKPKNPKEIEELFRRCL